ncbi:Ig-like domain-containing protein [Streptomyces celluloflavus]|uniref:L,D-transpeptidase n=1 Tax=Streptomyces celluloflavus TaxID=58344 RepID=UPI003795E0FF
MTGQEQDRPQDHPGDRPWGHPRAGLGGGPDGRPGPRPAPRPPRTAPRRARTAVVLVIALVGMVAGGCGIAEVVAGVLGSQEKIIVAPDDGAQGVRRRERFEVRVADGRLERVEAKRTGGDGQEPVAGRISPDGRSWRPAPGPLDIGTRYTVDAVAVDGEGRRVARHTTFTTTMPPHRFIGFFKPENNATVGTGMIVSLEFNRRIADRAAVERAITVTANPRVEIAAHWFGARRLDFRPREPWRPGTEVTVDLRLRNLKAGPGAYGTQRKTVHFRIGRDQSSVVDVAAHTLTVRRAGRVTERLPVTAGDTDNPTYSGKMVILERHKVTRMDGKTVGFVGEYNIPDVPHAMRLTRSGTFLHGNYWTEPDVFGDDNTSHGCIGLPDTKGGGRDTPAGRVFGQSLIGDIVEVRNSGERTVAPDNGLGGWNMPWQQWRAGTALG